MDMNNKTLITLSWELYGQGVSQIHIAQQLNKHRETVGLWLKGVKQLGLMSFLNQYDRAKKGPRICRRVNPVYKRWVWDIREREMDCCGQKIQYWLQKDRQVHLSVPKIYEILAEKYTIKSKWKKNQVRGEVPHAFNPREVIQMDTVDFGDIFAFTGVDIFTKEVDILLALELNAKSGCQFLEQSMDRRFNHFVKLIQTDGGPEFKKEFRKNVGRFCHRYRVSRPYRKNDQSFIESFNRTLRKECLGWGKYRPDQLQSCQSLVESFLDRYHYHRPHMSLNMTPPLLKFPEAGCRISTEN